MNGGARRYWEVDAARGVAILMVALYHLMFDLDNFGGYAIESTSGFWKVFADTSAFAFVFLVGVSLTLSLRRAEDPAGGLPGKYLRRGLRIFVYGMLITLIFWTFGLGAVVFGILHLIGVSIILAYPFLRLRWANLALGLALVALGWYVGSLGLSADGAAGILLAPLGVSPEGLYMPDYRPLLPWFGVVLAGIFAGNLVYGGKPAPRRAGPAPVRPLAFLGRHTLIIYLVHQPVILAILALFGVISLG